MERNEAITVEPLPQARNHPGQPGVAPHEGTKRDGEGKPDVPAAPSRSKIKTRIVLLAVVLLVGVASAFYYCRFIEPYESTDNAFIESHVTPIAPQVPGRVDRLSVQDNQMVSQGDLLLEIDPRDYQARLAQAQAALLGARSRLEQTKAQSAVDDAKVEQERANLNVAESEASRAQADLKRYQAVESRAVSRSQLDLAETQARSAGAQVLAARSKMLAAQAQLGLSRAAIDTAAADIQQSEAAVRQAELNLSYTRVTAPQSGRVTRRTVEQGAYVNPGQALMALVPRQFWVVANFKETQLARMRVGQAVEIKVDAHPGLKLKGRIESLQNGSGARFSMFPPENATGNYIKVVQRVPVKIVCEDIPDQLVLGPGMSVEPTVRVK
jgi:membrane fusion protein (multidrug efflux system)